MRALGPLGDLGDALLRPVRRTAEDATLGMLERVLDSRVTGQAVEMVAARILNGPELERIVAAAVDSPAVERMVARVIESRLLDATVTRLLESEDLWILVDEVARSPAVLDAVTHQGVGFADQVADRVRGRSERADARLEHLARRLLRRSPNGVATGEQPGTAAP
jgi:hypothetical protein